MNRFRYLLGLIMLIFITGCQQVDQQNSGAEIDRSTDAEIDRSTDNGKLKVVATTTIVGDVVDQIGGQLIDLSILLPVGTDPHAFDPTPQDVAKMTEADIVFANGAGLEDFLESMIESAGAKDKVVHVSDGIELMAGGHHDEHEGEKHHDEDEGEEHHDEHEGEEHHDEHEGEEHHDEHEGEEHHHDHGGNDPHTWFNPSNVMVWAHNIADALGEMDPDNSQAYTANEESYKEELTELDGWIRGQVALIPEGDRNLVTDHSVFAYFSAEYGFTQVGTLIPSYSTLGEPTAQELAQVQDAIQLLNVKAVFVGTTFNPGLGEQVADDTGTELVFVYTGSLSESDGDAGTYLDYMRYNTTAIVNALK